MVLLTMAATGWPGSGDTSNSPFDMMYSATLCRPEQSALSHTSMCCVSPQVELDKARRRDRQLRDPDYDSHMGLMRDPVTREVVTTATHT